MKIVLLTLTAMLSFGSLKSTAQDIQVSVAVTNAFNTSFKQASDVQWKDCGNYYKADFVLNGQYVTAFYDGNAALLAVTKNISPVQLPVTLQASLKKSYENYWISEAMEYSNEGGTSYYVTVEDGDCKVTLKSLGTNWTIYKKQHKS